MKSITLKRTTAFDKIGKLQGRERIAIGSARSSKTYSILQLIILWCLEQTEAQKVLITAPTYNQLHEGAIEDLIKILSDMGLYNNANLNKNEKTYKLGKCKIVWASADEGSKFRGRNYAVAFFNESNLIDKGVISEVMLRLTSHAFFDLNPTHYGAVKSYIKLDEEGNETNVVRLTFKDNEYCPKGVLKEFQEIIERAKDSDYWAKYRDVYIYGIEAAVEGAIYNNWEIVPSRPVNSKLRGHGADWGFSNDPSTHLTVYEVEADVPTLYVRENLCSPKLSTRAFFDLVTQNETVYDAITISDVNPLIISELSDLGLPIKAAKKGAGSIQAGIQVVQGYKLLIDVNSKNLIEELKLYQWEKDKDENPLPVAKDKDNHCLDALRYIVTYITESVSRKFCLKLIA